MSPRRVRIHHGKSGAARRAGLEREALLAARTLVDRMRTLYRELERMTGAPITMYRALACIGENPGLPASQLAARLGMQRPAVSHVLKGLSARGWIERRRSDGDQRSVRISPTSQGQQILRATSGRAVGTLQRAVRGLSTLELRQLAGGLSSLLALLPEAPPAPARTPASIVPRRPVGVPRPRISART